MFLNEINLRDPFILADNGRYYLYGTRGSVNFGEANGFDVYVSDDLENWNMPKEIFSLAPNFWATENFWAPKYTNITENIICLPHSKAIPPAAERKYWYLTLPTANLFR